MCAQQKSVSKNPCSVAQLSEESPRQFALRSTQTWIAPSIVHRFCIHYLITIYYYHMVDQDYYSNNSIDK